MIKFLLLTIAALASGQHHNDYLMSKMRSYGYDDGQDYGHRQTNAYKSYSKCPTLKSAQNNDFKEFDGLWFRVQETPEGHVPTTCSINVHQLTSHHTQHIILRNPEMMSHKNDFHYRDNDQEEVKSGPAKKIDESRWIVDFQSENRRDLVTVLASDHHKGYAMIHACNVDEPKNQVIHILSRSRHLDQKTIDRLHQTLIKSGLDNLEAQLKDVDQDHCNQKH